MGSSRHRQRWPVPSPEAEALAYRVHEELFRESAAILRSSLARVRDQLAHPVGLRLADAEGLERLAAELAAKLPPSLRRSYGRLIAEIAAEARGLAEKVRAVLERR